MIFSLKKGRFCSRAPITTAMSEGDPKRSRRTAYLTIFAATLLSQALLSTPYYVGLYNDDACYLTRAFQFTGATGLSPELLRANLASTFAAGWPLILSLFTFVLGDHYQLYRVVSLVLVMITGGLFYHLTLPRVGPRGALLASGVLLFSGATLQVGTTLYSEPLFVCLTLLLVFLEGKGEKAKIWPGCLVVGFAMLTRTEGQGLFMALILSSLLRKEWKRAALQTGLILGTALPLRSLLIDGSIHAGQMGNFLRNVDFGRYLPFWLNRQAGSLSTALIGEQNLFLKVLVAALSLLAFAGALKWWKEEKHCGPLILWILPGVLLFWPYFDARYWMAILPLWLLGLLFVIPKPYRIGFLSLVLAGQLTTQLFFQEPLDLVPEAQLYQELRQTPIGSKVVCLYSCRLLLQGQRQPVQIGSFRSFLEMLIFSARYDAPYILWLRESNLLSSEVSRQMNAPEDLILWLKRSPLLEMVKETRAGVVVRLKVEPQAFNRAFELYVTAARSQDPQEKLELIGECLKLVPDFPQAQLEQLQLGLQLKRLEPEVALDTLTQYCRRYPHSEEALPMFLGLLPNEELRPLLELQLKDASMLERNDRVARLKSFESVLSQE